MVEGMSEKIPYVLYDMYKCYMVIDKSRDLFHSFSTEQK